MSGASSAYNGGVPLYRNRGYLMVQQQGDEFPLQQRYTVSYRPSYNRRDSLKSINSLAQRLEKYQHQIRRQEEVPRIRRHDYQQNLAINDRIAQMEKRFGKKSSETRKFVHNNEKTLRLAESGRAKALVEQYFNNPNPKRSNLSDLRTNQPTRSIYGPTARFYVEEFTSSSSSSSSSSHSSSAF